MAPPLQPPIQEPGFAPAPYPASPYPPAPYPASPFAGPYPPGEYAPGPYPPGPYTQVPYPQGAYAPEQFTPTLKPTPLPVEPQDYHQFYRTPAFRWWKPLLAVLLFGAIWVPAAILIVAVPLVWSMIDGTPLTDLATELNTPAFFLANNVLLAAAIPAAMLSSWAVYRQRPGYLSSVTGRLRWGMLGQFLLIAAPVLIVWMVADMALTGGFSGLSWGPDSLLLLVGILLTTPLQAAGEEYMTRGLLARSVGSWFSNRWLALVVATVVNGTVFMLLHSAQDPWLNSFYFTVAVVFTLVTWRTGGLEAAIAMHVVNNLVGELTLPFSPDEFSHLFDRQAGVAGPETLIQIGVTLLIGALIWWRASRLNMVRRAAPGATLPGVPAPGYPAG